MSEQAGWERKVLENLATESLKEQRRRRRWGIFFKLIVVAYVGFFLWMVWQGRSTDGGADGGAHTAVIEIKGVIAPDGEASAANVNAALRDAFKNDAAKGVVLKINSPGGSPVQAGQIYDEIKRLKATRPNLPVYAVVEELCASGGYYIAAGADKIYVDKASMIGSIGVIMNGFGFTGTMEKLGVERRALTSGENKAFLDPFQPQVPSQVEHAKEMISEIHAQFIDAVRKGRGKRLHETPDMFSGLVWTGAKSIELGLADATGNVRSVARDVIKAETLRDYTEREPVFERVARRFGGAAASSFLGGLFESQYR
ncbi:S49 family peptidase [Niveibacterium sp. SC-1]|uniref:S49 family peptidase n=1 Tax=Niveibacterium sp. SC-1 TaxID=3135646 RepID=UPI00311F6630